MASDHGQTTAEPPTSLEAMLRAARSQSAAYEALRDSLREIARRDGLHMQFYTGDLLADLLTLVPRALDGTLQRQQDERDQEQREKLAAHIASLLAKAEDAHG